MHKLLITIDKILFSTITTGLYVIIAGLSIYGAYTLGSVPFCAGG